MPELIHNFMSGRMNKDIDERMIPNGEYRDALNVTVATSEDSHVGTVQNIKGNTQRKGKGSGVGTAVATDVWTANYISDLTNPICIGSIRHEPTECIYWFITSEESNNPYKPAVNAIAEYNTKTKVVRPVIVDTKNILKFNSKYHITGINIVDDLLFWTDNNSEPKKINIKKFKNGSSTFFLHSKIPTYDASTGNYSATLGADFVEADVTVIKKSPLSPLQADISTSTRSAAGESLPGTGVTPLSCTYAFQGDFPSAGDKYYNFTYITTPSTAFLNAEFGVLPTYGEWLEDSLLDVSDQVYAPNMETVTIMMNQEPTGWLPDDIIVLSGSLIDDDNNTDEYQIRIKIDSINGQYVEGKIQSIPSEILRFGEEEEDEDLITWEVLLEEKDPMFEFVFARFAYRWKYENGEYSCFSPFTQVIFEGDDFEYLSSDGYNLGMMNHIRSLILKDWSWGSEEVVELDILYKHSTSNNIYIVDTLKDKTQTTFQIKTELIGKTVEANQLLRPWDNVPKKALAQEISANRLIYANYEQNFDVPKSKIVLDVNSSTHPGTTEEDSINKNRPFPSVKTIRKYQLGIVFQDAYGRQTPVFTNPDATYNLDKENAEKVNKFTAKLNTISNLPEWITHAKYFIKDTSNEYYNLALDRYYLAEDGNVWLSFPSSERNKVDLETYLVLKKQHNNDKPSIGPCRYKILDIENEAPDFIKTTKKVVGSAECTVIVGFQNGYSEIKFEGPATDDNTQFRQGFSGDHYIQILQENSRTEIRSIESGGPGSGEIYTIKMEEPFDSDANWMGTNGLQAGTSVTIRIYEDKIEKLPEFEGRFFVKINRDTDFETNVIKPFNDALNIKYDIVGSIKVSQKQGTTNSRTDGNIYAGFSGGNSDKWGFYLVDEGETEEDGCSTCPDEWRLLGIGSNGFENKVFNGAPANSEGGANMSDVYDPPKTGGKTMSIVYVGSSPANNTSNPDDPAFIDGFNENILYSGTPLTDAVEGKYINILGKAGTANAGLRSEKPLKIEKHYRFGGKRGATKCLCVANPSNGACTNDCQKTSSSNRKFALCLQLEDPIEGDWVGVGSNSDLDNISGFELLTERVIDNNSILTSTNPAIFETEPKEAIDLDIYYEASEAFPIAEINGTSEKILDYFNCYSFGNAVESDRIRDDFNAPKIGKGVKVSSIFEGPYAKERRGSGLIFSQIYNSMSGINRTNQFIQAEPITKDLNPEYGSIQKLKSRNTNLITLCEDKCLQILANKDALFEAGGNAQLISNNKVLGQTIPYAGEFGISTNPESFTSYGFRSYFADKNRGAIIRLSQDGITNIALKGMADFFSDNLPLCTKIIGSYDDDKENYNITLDTLTAEWQDKLSKTPKDRTHCEVDDDTSDNIYTTTFSFKETVGGWTSRKSYYSTVDNIVYPLESAVSINDRYYTFNRGLIWDEYSNDTYNNIYDTQYDSSVNVVLNDATETIKGFKTLNFSGSNSRKYTYGTSTGLSGLTIEQIIYQQITPTIINSETLVKTGWYTNYINTDIEEGSIKEFKKKENKWFQKIKGLTNKYVDNCDNNIDSSSFPVQGLGNATITSSTPTTYNITVSVDTDCSTGGIAIPNMKSYFWYKWDGAKGPIDIRPEATDQLVKCAIESFYNGYEPGETNINKISQKFAHLSDSEIDVGTYLYNDYAPYELIGDAWNGKYLYLSTQSAPSNDALNANVPETLVPDTYYVITIVDSQITAKTQYNTLDACALGPDTTFTAHLGWFKNISGQGNYVINWRYYAASLSSGTWEAKAIATKDQIMYWLNSSSIVNQTNLGYFTYNYKYLASDGLIVGSTLYKDDGTALDTSLNDGIIVYRTDQVAGNIASPLAVRELLMNNVTWAALPNTYKFIAFENGVITLVKNMNEI